jgi:hypothetical protein
MPDAAKPLCKLVMDRKNWSWTGTKISVAHEMRKGAAGTSRAAPQRRRSTTIPAMIVSFNIATGIRGTVAVKR